MPFKTISSEFTYRGRAFNVRRDQVRTPNGQVLHLDIVAHVGAVTVIPLDQAGQVWFVRQYRHATGGLLLELPAGTLEESEPPEECARREIREETGMAASRLEKVGEFFLAPGYSTEYMHVYLATGLFPDPLPGDVDEFIDVEQIPVERVYRMATEGAIRDAKTLAALLLAYPRMPLRPGQASS